jgi:hypothetical protein
MNTLHLKLSALSAPVVVLMTASVARAQSSLWDSLIWDQDVWQVPEPDLTSMAMAGAVMLALLQRARRSATHVNPRRARK